MALRFPGRKALRDVNWLRSFYYLLRAVIRAFADTRTRSRAKLDRLHSTSPDVWRYSTVDQFGKARFLREASMLDRVCENRLFARAIEIGCHEGAFTELLAPRCEGVLAVDFSPTVLDRARQRNNWTNVEFQEFDLRADLLPGEFDLIIVTSVFESFYRPNDLRSAREKLVRHLRLGGYLLVGNVRENEIFESARWARWLVRGGKRISEFIASDHRLTLVAQESDDLYVDSLFLRTDSLPGGSANQ